MGIFRVLILQIIVLLFITPVYATDTAQEAVSNVLISPSTDSKEEEISNGHTILSDYTYNDIAFEAVERNITLFTGKIKDRFSLWLSRSGKYLELMREILKERDVPEEIAFLPLIESGFNPYAYSRASAVGYWQFIASTAKKYGLAIDWWRDERRDPVKSTVAAANYLKDLYEMFGSWNLAMAAYNAGEGKILRALNKARTDNYWALLNTNHIKSETKNYVPKFIAASLIANSPENFGFDEIDYYPPINYDEVTVESPLDLDVAAECAETTIDVIKELNPELRRWCTPPDVSEYTLKIPAGKKEIFLDNLSNVPEQERFSMDVYIVKKGDTFTRISKKTAIPIQVILDLNDLQKKMPLKIGMNIYLPPKGKFKPQGEEIRSIKKASFKYNKKQKPKKKKI